MGSKETAEQTGTLDVKTVTQFMTGYYYHYWEYRCLEDKEKKKERIQFQSWWEKNDKLKSTGRVSFEEEMRKNWHEKKRKNVCKFDINGILT